MNNNTEKPAGRFTALIEQAQNGEQILEHIRKHEEARKIFPRKYGDWTLDENATLKYRDIYTIEADRLKENDWMLYVMKRKQDVEGFVFAYFDALEMIDVADITIKTNYKTKPSVNEDEWFNVYFLSSKCALREQAKYTHNLCFHTEPCDRRGVEQIGGIGQHWIRLLSHPTTFDDWYEFTDAALDYSPFLSELNKAAIKKNNPDLAIASLIRTYYTNPPKRFIEFKSKSRAGEVSKPKSQKTYILKDDNTSLYKIGKSVNPKHRERTLQSEKPTIKMVKTWDKDIEAELHKKYESQRVRGEWFNLTEIQIRYICKHY
jgi:hypothetical protein